MNAHHTAGARAADPLPPVALDLQLDPAPQGIWRVLHVTVEEGMCVVCECVVDILIDAGPHAHSLDPAEVLGRHGVLVMARSGVTRNLPGIVRRVEDRGTLDDQRLVRVWLVASLWLLAQRTDSRIFQDMTAVQVVSAVLRAAGLYADTLIVTVTAVLATRAYCVQHRETDLAFIQRLLEDEGIAWHTESVNGREGLVLADDPGAYKSMPTLDGSPVILSGPDLGLPTRESVQSAAWVAGLHGRGVVVHAADFTRPLLDLTRHAPCGAALPTASYYPHAEAMLHGYRDGMYRQDTVQRQADLRADVDAASARTLVAQSTLVGAAAGTVFTLMAPGHESLEGRYRVLRVSHTASAPEHLRDPAARHHPHARYHNEMTCVPESVRWRPARETPRPVVGGLQTATVVGPVGESVHTDVHGRIRVRFHWDHVPTRGDGASCWIRVLQPWAGAGWGAVFLPRVGMEVVVDFIDGHPDHPVVLGCLYNGAHPPPFDLPAQRTRSGLRSHTAPGEQGGNELSFEDATGAEQLYLHAQRDLDVVARQDHSTTVLRNADERVAGRRNRHVGGHECVRVAGDQDLDIGGDANLAVAGDRHAVVGGQSTVHVARGRYVTVDQGEALRVTSGGRHVAVDGDLDTLEVAGDKRDAVTGAWDAEVGDRWCVTQGATRWSLDGGHVACATRGRIVLATPGTSAVLGDDSGVMTLEAHQELRLVCGASSLVLASDGTVTLRGARQVTVGAGETTLVLDRESATLSGPRVTTQALGVHEIAGALIRIG